MTFTQKKRFCSTLIFTLNEEKLKVTRKGLTSRNSYEVSINDLDPNKLEESNFSVPWLIATILFSGITIMMWFGAITLEVKTEDTAMLWIFSFMPLVLALFSVYRFKNHTYSFLHLCRLNDGAVLVSFYNHSSDDRNMLDFIDNLYDPPKRSHTGFLQH